RPRKRRRKRGVLLLQPGPGPRSRGLRQSARATQPERRAGKADAAVDRPLAAPSGPAADRGGVVSLAPRKRGEGGEPRSGEAGEGADLRADLNDRRFNRVRNPQVIAMRRRVE